MSDSDAPGANAPEFSVSELSSALKRAIEDRFGYVRVRGEISGYRGPHSSGHVYFSLKDANARLDAVIWKGVFGRMRVKPEEGLEVVVTGKIMARLRRRAGLVSIFSPPRHRGAEPTTGRGGRASA